MINLTVSHELTLTLEQSTVYLSIGCSFFGNKRTKPIIKLST